MILAAAGGARAADDVLVWFADATIESTGVTELSAALTSAGAPNVDQTRTWPATLGDYRLIFLFAGRLGLTYDAGRVAELQDFLNRDGVLVVVGEASSFMTSSSGFNATLAGLGTTMELDAGRWNRLCGHTALLVDTSAWLLDGVGTVSYAYSGEVDVHDGTGLLEGESGQTLLAVDGRVLVASDSNLFTDDCTLGDGNRTLLTNLYTHVEDFDGDGALSLWYAGDDCDDTDADAWPGNTERCDGVDNDCDGATDPDDASDVATWYLDADGDGFGVPTDTHVSCEAPSGYVATDDDCDDTEPAVSPGDDEWCNGIDDDCDGDTDEDEAYGTTRFYADADGDGYGDPSDAYRACTAPSGRVADATDCDDDDAAVNPGASERCDGATDEDCDGTVDEDDAIDAVAWYADGDHDDYGDAADTTPSCGTPHDRVLNASDCDDTDSRVNPDAAETCDVVDNDCDGAVDEDDALDAVTWHPDADADGYGATDDGARACDAPTGYVDDDTDCDDADPEVNPGATETPYDGRDDDCSGTDLCDADGDGFDAAACAGDDCDDTDAWAYPDAPDVFYDGVDSDCAGNSDYDRDGDGQDSTSFGGLDCDDGDPSEYDGAPDEAYDGLVTDCDSTDEYDVDADGYRAEAAGGDDCDDERGDVHPGAEETWYDGVDQDCDGGSDGDADADGFDAAGVGGEDCDDADPAVHPGAAAAADGTPRDCTGGGPSPPAEGCGGCAGTPDVGAVGAATALLLLARRGRGWRS